MKINIIFIAAFALSMGAMAKGGGHVNSSNHTVSGQVTKSGTYVQPHHATNRDSTKENNYSQKGNVNPYTGREGTKNWSRGTALAT